MCLHYWIVKKHWCSAAVCTFLQPRNPLKTNKYLTRSIVVVTPVRNKWSLPKISFLLEFRMFYLGSFWLTDTLMVELTYCLLYAVDQDRVLYWKETASLKLRLWVCCFSDSSQSRWSSCCHENFTWEPWRGFFPARYLATERWR